MHIVMFSPAMIALQEELATGFHPELVKVLAHCESLEEYMSALATYASILVDDSFNQSKLDDLCDEVLKFLKANRKEKPPLIITQLH